jgi:hypothetical protein
MKLVRVQGNEGYSMIVAGQHSSIVLEEASEFLDLRLNTRKSEV